MFEKFDLKGGWLHEIGFVYLRIKEIKAMNIQKVMKFIELQERVNREIEIYGTASSANVEMLEEIGDSLSHEEITESLKLYYPQN